MRKKKHREEGSAIEKTTSKRDVEGEERERKREREILGRENPLGTLYVIWLHTRIKKIARLHEY